MLSANRVLFQLAASPYLGRWYLRHLSEETMYSHISVTLLAFINPRLHGLGGRVALVTHAQGITENHKSLRVHPSTLAQTRRTKPSVFVYSLKGTMALDGQDSLRLTKE